MGRTQMNMSIRKYLGTSVLSVALLLACGLPALAENSQTVTFHHDFVVNGITLPAGNCVVRWETKGSEATVEFVGLGTAVLSTEGRLEVRSKTSDRNVVVYGTAWDGTMSLVEIRFAYSNEVLVFNQ